MTRKSLTKLSTVIVLCVTAAACTNSKLVLRPIYNSLDNRLEDRFLEYAEFNEEQVAAIQELADHFHVWHRKTQLPNYALLLEDIVDELDAPNAISEQTVTTWSKAIQGYTSKIGSCNPFYSSASVIASLSDEQIEAIQNHRIERRKERDLRRANNEEDPDDLLADSASERVKQIKRYLGFIGISLTAEQVTDLSNTMNSTIRPEKPFRVIADELDAEFYALLKNRKQPDWGQQFIAYIDHRRQALSDHFEKTRNHNRQVWEAYTLRTFKSLNNNQRQTAKQFLSGLANTVSALSEDQPSANSLDATEYACVGVSMG